MTVSSWLDRHQAGAALAAVAVGVAVGSAVPDAGDLDVLITPLLGLLLYCTFLAVPLRKVMTALTDLRFLAVLLALNFVVVPVMVFGLSRFVANDDALLIGVLLVLLTPCIDYVIVFTALAGGAHDRLLAASPVLLLLQLLLLPGYLALFAGPQVLTDLDPGPFLEALGFLIVLPLAAAAATQWWGTRSAAGRRVQAIAAVAMTPLLLATLLVVVASQVPGLTGRWAALLPAVVLFIVFAVVMTLAGVGTGRVAGFDAPTTTALTFSGVTRNSLVVLPLALALPAPLAVAAAVVVTQTLVELVAMVVLVRVLPRVTAAAS